MAWRRRLSVFVCSKRISSACSRVILVLFSIKVCVLRQGWTVIVFVALEFARLVRANQSMVFSLALRFLRNHEVAEAVSQDVFLQLYQNLGRIQNEAHAKWWLRRTICHRAIDEFRKRKLRPQISLDSVADPAASR